MDNAFDISDEAILADATAFLAEATESQKKKLCRFLREHPRRVTLDSIFPEKELSLRLELIGELRRRLQQDFGTSEEPFHFSNIQIAALSLMSVETLQDLRQDASFMMTDSTLYYHLPFLVHGTFPAARNIFAAMVTQIASKSIYRNNQGHEKCFLKDLRVCVLTGTTYAIPCYIAPVGLTTSHMNMDTVTDSIFLSKLMGDVGVQIGRIMATDSLGAFNKSWNMLCLHPTLCKWWSECLFGLRYLDMATNDDGSTAIQIQFNWMPRNEVEPDLRVEPAYDGAIDAMLQITVTDEQRDFFYYLSSGASFEVTVDNREEALKMKAALEFQWVAVRLAAMSGFARFWKWELELDSYEDEIDEDDEDNRDLDLY
ncbi:uncharacterized protein Triagg1_3978 [Trichoderma aggressivum f. europaeum]|uniref:HNH nuclease domain-containing protein n=1 Tax=Trichoderma aggressivum f. europaeum TaxID=173218 RepID=A0AAE1IID0_9HYPO|nr:hypothetical protein Triagg1_3978 [Trichoderma aggressivum f. europaeum]